PVNRLRGGSYGGHSLDPLHATIDRIGTAHHSLRVGSDPIRNGPTDLTQDRLLLPRHRRSPEIQRNPYAFARIPHRPTSFPVKNLRQSSFALLRRALVQLRPTRPHSR